MIKAIAYNPETHVLVARTASGVMQAAMEAQWEAGSYVDMAKRECVAAIAAAPQHEPVDECWACNGTGVVTTSSNWSGLIEAPCKNSKSEQSRLSRCAR